VFTYYHADEAVAKAYGASVPSIKVFRSFDKTPADFTEFPLDAAVLAEFVDANGFPLVVCCWWSYM
jgi:hypothetical protein